MTLSEELSAAIEDDLSHLHLLPGDTKLKKARVKGSPKDASPVGAGTKARGGLPGYRPGFTVRHQTLPGY